MERCLVSLIIREMQIKTTMRYQLTLVWMAIIKKSTNHKCWRECGEKGILLHCWWECKLIQPLWRTVWEFLKKKTRDKTNIWPNSPLTGHIPWGNHNWKSYILFILSVLGLCCYADFSLVAASGGYSLGVVCGLLTAVTSLVVEHGL